RAIVPHFVATLPRRGPGEYATEWVPCPLLRVPLVWLYDAAPLLRDELRLGGIRVVLGACAPMPLGIASVIDSDGGKTGGWARARIEKSPGGSSPRVGGALPRGAPVRLRLLSLQPDQTGRHRSQARRQPLRDRHGDRPGGRGARDGADCLFRDPLRPAEGRSRRGAAAGSWQYCPRGYLDLYSDRDRGLAVRPGGADLAGHHRAAYRAKGLDHH